MVWCHFIQVKEKGIVMEKLLNKKVSIIVPIFKAEPYLDKCIRSIVSQTYHNLEIILVDDGSPDNCPAICDEWAKKDSRIKVIHKENGGVSSARNEGLKVVTGDYLQFVDSDDTIENNFAETLVSAMGENIDIVCSGFKIITDNKKVIEYRVSNFISKDILKNANDFFQFVLCRLFDVTVNKLFKMELAKDITFNTALPLGEDREFNLKYFEKVTGDIAFVDSVGYNYEYNQSSAIHKKRDNSYELLKMGINNLLDYSKKTFENFACDNYYKIIGGFVNAVLSITPKNKLKETIQKLKSDLLVKEYIASFKPKGLKEKLRFWLIKKNKYKILRVLSNIKNKFK